MFLRWLPRGPQRRRDVERCSDLAQLFRSQRTPADPRSGTGITGDPTMAATGNCPGAAQASGASALSHCRTGHCASGTAHCAHLAQIDIVPPRGRPAHNAHNAQQSPRPGANSAQQQQNKAEQSRTKQNKTTAAAIGRGKPKQHSAAREFARETAAA